MKRLFLSLVLSCSLASAADLTVSHLTFKAGEPWIEQPKSHMVKGALTFGKDGPLLKFYHFGKGQGGGVDANLRRWAKQFKEAPKIEKKDHGKYTSVKMTGTYMVGGMMVRNKVETPDYMLLGAIIPHPDGDVFLKMTAPEAKLKEAQAAFDKLLASAFAE